MKNFKKIASAIAALSLAACVAVPMSATVFTASATVTTSTVTTGKITINDDATAHKYKAYLIFKGTLTKTVDNKDTAEDSKDDITTYTIADIAWNDAVIDTTKLDENLADVGLTGVSDYTDAKAVSDALSKATDDDSVAQKFAQAIRKCFNDTVTPTIGETDFTFADDKFTATVTTPGYYLIEQTAVGEKGDAYTRFLLKVFGEEEVNTKASYPSVVKKVQENTDITDDYKYNYGSENAEQTESNYNDVADYNIGDAVPFRLYGTLPDTLGDYDTYTYKFTDTLGTEFNLPVATNIKVYLNTVADDNEITAAKYPDAGLTITPSGNSIMVSFTDIKKVTGVDKDSVIIVDYSAVLNSNAKVGLPGQENEVYLEYSNNPNKSGEGSSDSTGKTPEDKVIVFTYEIDSIKVADNETTGAPLKDAEFKLYRKTGDGGATLEYAKFEESTTGEYTFNGWTTEEGSAGVMKSADATGKFNMKGLDDGTYYIVETKAPSGYNKLNDPITVVINATTANGQTWNDFAPASALTNFTGTYAEKTDSNASSDNGTVSGKVVNEKGASLPSTGGIGTTLFYLGGGALVAVAGVMLITKKRMTKE